MFIEYSNLYNNKYIRIHIRSKVDITNIFIFVANFNACHTLSWSLCAITPSTLFWALLVHLSPIWSRLAPFGPFGFCLKTTWHILINELKYLFTKVFEQKVSYLLTSQNRSNSSMICRLIYFQVLLSEIFHQTSS